MSRYRDTKTKVVENQPAIGTTVYTVPAESTQDYYVISTFGDRFDILANEYYSDSSLWYIIAAANPHIRRDSIIIPEGQQIRIPLPLSNVLSTIKSQNSTR